MKKLIVFLAVALAIPTSVAFAKAPSTHANLGKSNPKVMYILKGTFSSFVPATSTADGSITITVTHANYHARALKNGPPLTFAVAPNTRITFVNGTTTLGPHAKGMVKFRAPLRMASGTDLATALPAMAKALHVIIQNG
jgi:hypothetical protein